MKKSEKLKELLGLEPVSLMINNKTRLHGLDMLNVKMTMTGSNVRRGKMKELDRQDARGTVLRITWKI